MGPGTVPSELYSFAAKQMVRLWDPIVVEGTLALDIPVQFEGGDNCMLVKSALKSSQDLKNLRVTLLVDQEPKMVGSVLRQRLAQPLKGHISDSQWGAGFGLGCELAHVGWKLLTVWRMFAKRRSSGCSWTWYRLSLQSWRAMRLYVRH